MNRVQIKPSVDQETANRWESIAGHYGMTGAGLAALLITEYSRVRKDGLFQALASIPDDLKTRPVGRPSGSTKAAKTEEAAHAAA